MISDEFGEGSAAGQSLSVFELADQLIHRRLIEQWSDDLIELRGLGQAGAAGLLSGRCCCHGHWQCTDLAGLVVDGQIADAGLADDPGYLMLATAQAAATGKQQICHIRHIQKALK